jgi:cobalamin biosynthesis protein CbiD
VTAYHIPNLTLPQAEEINKQIEMELKIIRENEITKLRFALGELERKYSENRKKTIKNYFVSIIKGIIGVFLK